MLKYKYNDGGRAEAGFKGVAGDCGVRACAIATGIPYSEVYKTLKVLQKSYVQECKEKVAKSRSERVRIQYCAVINSSGIVRDGVFIEVMRRFFESIGWTWVHKMHIGSGCTMHLGDMPERGTYVCRLARHYVAVVDGVVNDIFQDDQGSCVYGYWLKIEKSERTKTRAKNWYITTVKDGNILAWVEGSEFVSLHNSTKCPKVYVTKDEALKALAKVPNNSGLKVREAVTQVEWR